MESKEIKIEAPEGYVAYKEGDVIKFKKEEVKLPTSWEELKGINGYYIAADDSITTAYWSCATVNRNKKIFPTKEYAEAVLALAQLLQLRERYIGDWKPNWIGINDYKYCITTIGNKIDKAGASTYNNILSFPTEKLRDTFLTNFKDLLEIAKPLL